MHCCGKLSSVFSGTLVVNILILHCRSIGLIPRQGTDLACCRPIILTPKINFQILLEIQVSISSYLLIFSIQILCPLLELSMLKGKFCYPHQSLQDWLFFYQSNTCPWYHVYFRNLVLILSFPLLE